MQENNEAVEMDGCTRFLAAKCAARVFFFFFGFEGDTNVVIVLTTPCCVSLSMCACFIR